jgi:phosphoribosylformylglycinamidine cyclo-ligase
MSDEELKYSKRGVSARKEDVHKAIENMDKGLYPNAFCKILPDITGGDDQFCNIMHSDTAGTKPSLAYLYWKETGDTRIWENIVQDAIVMNLDDLACVGALEQVVFSSTIARNNQLIPGEVVSTLIGHSADYMKWLREQGIEAYLAGGETADVGDIVRTVDVGYTAFVRLPREKAIVNNIQAGDVIVGLASFGQATYEEEYNSGIGSNGLTSARHDVLAHTYAQQYPESYDPHMPEELVYVGDKKLTDKMPQAGQTVGELLLSPTRTYAPVINHILKNYRKAVHGLVHCTGGAQTKVLNFIDQLKVVKDNVFPVPPVFEMIQTTTSTSWKEMYQVFNMGHRLEIYVKPGEAEAIRKIAHQYNIDTRIVGKCEEADEKQVQIKTPDGVVTYS